MQTAQEALQEAARLMQESIADQALACSRAPHTKPERIVAPSADQYSAPKQYRLDRVIRSSLHHRKVIKHWTR